MWHARACCCVHGDARHAWGRTGAVACGPACSSARLRTFSPVSPRLAPAALARRRPPPPATGAVCVQIMAVSMPDASLRRGARAARSRDARARPGHAEQREQGHTQPRLRHQPSIGSAIVRAATMPCPPRPPRRITTQPGVATARRQSPVTARLDRCQSIPSRARPAGHVSRAGRCRPGVRAGRHVTLRRLDACSGPDRPARLGALGPASITRSGTRRAHNRLQLVACSLPLAAHGVLSATH